MLHSRKINYSVIIAFLTFLPGTNTAQDSIHENSGKLRGIRDRERKWIVASGHAAMWGGTFIALNKAWYQGYDKSGFHLFDDGGEWNQMDKAGHIWTAYQLSRASGATWKWAGATASGATWLGGASAMAFQSIIELQDAYSKKWGFSWWDMGANIAGTGIFISQQLGWKEQRVLVKLGYWPMDYPAGLEDRRNELFGKGEVGRLLKDYNGQAYWLSANVRSFFPGAKFPAWLNLAIGYGSDLMVGGMQNCWTTEEGVEMDYTYLQRVRRYYLSADIDLTRIPTRSKLLRSIFFAVNSIKVPAPAVEFNSQGKFRFHAIHH